MNEDRVVELLTEIRRPSDDRSSPSDCPRGPVADRGQVRGPCRRGRRYTVRIPSRRAALLQHGNPPAPVRDGLSAVHRAVVRGVAEHGGRVGGELSDHSGAVRGRGHVARGPHRPGTRRWAVRAGADRDRGPVQSAVSAHGGAVPAGGVRPVVVAVGILGAPEAHQHGGQPLVARPGSRGRPGSAEQVLDPVLRSRGAPRPASHSSPEGVRRPVAVGRARDRPSHRQSERHRTGPARLPGSGADVGPAGRPTEPDQPRGAFCSNRRSGVRRSCSPPPGWWPCSRHPA